MTMRSLLGYQLEAKRQRRRCQATCPCQIARRRQRVCVRRRQIASLCYRAQSSDYY